MSKVSERELRDALEVRIGLVGDRGMRRLLRCVFASKRLTDVFLTEPVWSHPWQRGCAERTIEVCRVVGAAAGTLAGVDRDLVTTAAIVQGVKAAVIGFSIGELVAEVHTVVKGVDGRARRALDEVLRVIAEAESEPDGKSPEAVVLRSALSMASAVSSMAVLAVRAHAVQPPATGAVAAEGVEVEGKVPA